MYIDDSSISVVQLVKALWRGAGLICAFGFAFILAALIYVTQFIDREYTTNAVLMIEAETLSAAGGILLVQKASSGSFSSGSLVEGEAERLTSQPVLREVIKRLALHENTQVIEDQPIGSKAAQLRAEDFLNNNLIVEVRKGTNLIEIWFTSFDPDLSYEVINMIIESYMLEQGQELLTVGQVNDVWAQEQLASVKRYIGFIEARSAQEQNPEEAVQAFKLAETAASAAMALFGLELSKLEPHTGELIRLGLSRIFSEVMAPAVYPEKPNSSGKLAILILAALFGGSLGVVWVLSRHVNDRRFNSSEDVRDTFDYPVWATFSSNVAAKSDEALKSNDVTASIRDLRSALLLKENVGRSTLVQLMPLGQSKNDIVIGGSLAASFVDVGRKVLFIDARVGISSSNGLLQLIKGTQTFDDVVTRLSSDRQEGDMLASGMTSSVDTDVLSMPAYANFLKNVSEKYDTVIVLTSPVLEDSGALMVSRDADVVLMLVDVKKSRESEILKARAHLQVKNDSIGFVLFDG